MGAFLLSPHPQRVNRRGGPAATLRPGCLCRGVPRASLFKASTPLSGSFLEEKPVRGKEGPEFRPMRGEIFGAVTLRIFGKAKILYPLKGGITEERNGAKKRNHPKPGKAKPADPPAGHQPGHEMEVLPVAEKKKTTKKTDKPAVLSGTVPEWASTTVIAQLLGYSVRRIQQLTQEGILETEVPLGGGARKYKTCETIQKYIAHIEQKAQETGENSRAAELTLKKLEAEVELKESQGQLHRLKTAIAEGKYIAADQATEELEEFVARFKRFALNIPARMAGTLSAHVDAVTARAMEKSMRKELEAMLAAFADAAEELREDPGT